MAVLAALLEEPAVRIGMTRTALLECQSRVFGRTVRHGVALLARHIDVRPRQWIARFRVIEFSCDLPVRGAVTPQAITAEPPLVLVFVTSRAGGGQSEKSLVEIMRRERGFLGRRDMRTVVTLRAVQARVLAVKLKARLQMVEGLGVPLNNLEILAVMLRVAADAITPRRGCRQNRRVITAASRYPRRNILVTLKATILRLTGPYLVARHASRGAIPLAVCLGKRPGADLRGSCNRQKHTPRHQYPSKETRHRISKFSFPG